MVQKDYYMTRTDGVKLYRSYSDLNMKIKQDQTGAIYDEAIDIESSAFTYTETDIPIDVPEEEPESEGPPVNSLHD